MNEENIDKKCASKIGYRAIYVAEILIFPIICYILLESIKFGNITSCIQICMLFLKNNPQYVIVAYMILTGNMLIIRSFTKNNFIGNCIFCVVTSIIVLVSYYKYQALELPFVPYDIFLIKNIDQIAQFGFTGLTSIMIFSILIFVFVFFVDYLLYKFIRKNNVKISIIERIIYLTIGILIIYMTCLSPNRYIRFNIKNDNGDMYAWMGANAVFFTHLGDFISEKPKNYNEEKINSIKNNYDIEIEQNGGINPNIILIMNESYADLTNFTNTQYSSNPMELIDELKSKGNCISGNILSPVYGGGTSLPEFEVLTGLSSYFLKEQIYPYTSYIHSDMNSIVREFNKNKYTTIGIHTNTRTFYNRENIYKYLGFQKTVFEENIENPEYKANYISDNEMAKQIIKEFESNRDKKFIFAVTMQNHMQYTSKKYGKYDVEIYSDILTEMEKTELKNYTQGVIDSNKMYIKLAEYFKKIEEPTILIMFGDHLPLLGQSNRSTYKKNGFNEEIDYYLTPYIIWTNYEMENSINIPSIISTSNLGLKVLDIANLKDTDWYIELFKEMYSRYPAINNKFIIDKNGNLIDRILDSDEELIDNCEIVQYDILIKKKYIDIN